MSIAIMVVVGLGLANLRVSTDVILWFKPDSAIRSDYNQIRHDFSGITPVNVVIRSLDEQPVTRSDVLTAIHSLTLELEGSETVGKAVSIAGILTRMNEIIRGDARAGLPKDPDVVEQYLVLLEGTEHLRDVLAPDRLAANILLRVDDNSSEEIVALRDWVDEWWARFGVVGYRPETTGVMFEFGRAEEEIAYGQLRGFGLAFVPIAIILAASLRRLRAALVALVPNVIPIVIAFGAMGILGIALDAATVCLGSLALGLAVDNTIHLMTRVDEGREQGLCMGDAISYAFSRALPAGVLSSLAISLGFGVLALSEFTLVRNLGVMTASLVALCLLADLTLLPALLFRGWESGRPSLLSRRSK
jgi:predicted RND superfamily exporter protein